MKLSIQKSELQRGLARLQAIVEKRSSMPILANVLLRADGKGDKGGLELVATDLEVGIRSRHPAAIQKAGGLTVSARKLHDIVRELPDEPVNLESTSNGYLAVQCDRAQFTLAGTEADEYPALPEFTAGKLVSLQAAVLSTMIERTMYAASTDETRYNLNGVYFEVIADQSKIRMVATDGHRLGLVDRGVGSEASDLGSGVIIPRKGLAELKRLVDEDDADEVEIGFEGNSGLARKGDVELFMRLIEGEFPNYNQVIPKQSEHTLTVPSGPFTRALRRVVLFSSERSHAVKIELSQGSMVLSSENPDLGNAREELDVDYDGESLTAGFNAKYLLDALGAMGGKEVRIGLRDGNSAAELHPTDDSDTLAVVMPMRL